MAGPCVSRDALGGGQGRPLPAAQFARLNRDGTPWLGILISTAVASLLMGFAYSSKTGLTVFEYLVDLSVVTVAIPYFFSRPAPS